jgi:hypothetical protein
VSTPGILDEGARRPSVATVSALKIAWFKDPDLNVLAIHD